MTPQSQNPDAGLDEKLAQTGAEENAEKGKESKRFKESSLGKQVETKLGADHKALFDRISTEIGNIQASIPDQEKLTQVIEKIFSPDQKASLGQIGYTFSENQITELRKELLAISGEKKEDPNHPGDMGKEGETKTNIQEEASSPEKSVLERLVKQGHLDKNSLETFEKNAKGKSEEERRALLNDVLKKIPNDKVRGEVTKSVLPTEQEKVTEASFKNTAFFQDAWNPKPEYSDFTAHIAENYTRIPDKDGSQDKQADFQVAMERSLGELKKKNSSDLNQTLSDEFEKFNAAKSNGERFMVLKSIFDQSQTAKAQAKQEPQERNNGNREKATQRLQQILDEAKKAQSGALEAQRNSQAQIKALEEQARARELANLEKGDIFSGGQLDQNNIGKTGAEKST